MPSATSGFLIQQYPLPLPKISLSMSLSWVLGNFTSHGTYAVGMMQVGWVLTMLMLPTNLSFVMLLCSISFVFHAFQRCNSTTSYLWTTLARLCAPHNLLMNSFPFSLLFSLFCNGMTKEKDTQKQGFNIIISLSLSLEPSRKTW